MTTVWVLTIWDGEGRPYIFGVYSTKEKAEKMQKDYVFKMYEQEKDISQWIIGIHMEVIDEVDEI